MGDAACCKHFSCMIAFRGFQATGMLYMRRGFSCCGECQACRTRVVLIS